jgi:lipoprotein-anchoring transpeptidase ErfK/SrfK
MVRRILVLVSIPVVVALAAVTLARRAPAPTEGVAVAEPVPTTTTTTVPEPTTTTVPAPTAAPHADPPRFPTMVAVAKVPDITVLDAPDGAPVTVLHSPAQYSKMPQIFTIIPTPDAPPGWLHVNLRVRPNGSTGWIRVGEVALDKHNWSIDINLTDHWATVYDGAEVFAATPVVTGDAVSPTPVGDSYVVEAVWTKQPGGAYGPFIYGLSSHSDVYTEFAGGDGQIGLHGTNQPQLLGSAASHGCVRFPNDVILRMANALPMGVPVHIHA